MSHGHATCQHVAVASLKRYCVSLKCVHKFFLLRRKRWHTVFSVADPVCLQAPESSAVSFISQNVSSEVLQKLLTLDPVLIILEVNIFIAELYNNQSHLIS